MPPGKPAINPAAPSQWTNVKPSEKANLTTCVKLIKGSTTKSGANNNLTRKTLKNTIAKGRTALWLRNDGLVAVVFHSLDGPTDDGGKRTPKFVVCAGVDPTAPPLDENDGGGDTYKSIRKAVKFFAKDNGNQDAARLFFVLTQDTPLLTGDLIKPFFDYALLKELDATEGAEGSPEDYTTTQGKSMRWPNLLKTYLIQKL